MVYARIQIALVLFCMAQLQIIQTDDGSPSLWNPDLGETYHSKFGALQESEHVFIEAGLEAISSHRTEISILEVGLGTGLNAALAAARNGASLRYLGLEPYPVDEKVLGQMNFGDVLSSSQLVALEGIWAAPFGQETEINQRFRIEKSLSGIVEYECGQRLFDVIFFDAFAPEIQGELWSVEVFKKIFEMTSTGGLFVTYCAKGQVRRDLAQAGYEVERLEGPPGKRHMLRATKR